MRNFILRGFRRILYFCLIFSFIAFYLCPDMVFCQNIRSNAVSSDEAVSRSEADRVPAENAPESEDIKKNIVSADPGNVTINFKGADIRIVLAYISEVAGVDIVPAPDVKGMIDLKLTNKPWKTALDIIARNYGYAYEREGDIIRVVTLEGLKQEELTTQAFPLNYSKAKDVMTSVNNVLGSRGKVIYDDRTNMLIVTDIPTNIYKVSQIVSSLDKRTQQVLIEARIIETVLGDDEKLGIDWNVKITAAGAKRPTTFPFDYYSADSNFFEKYNPLVQTGAITTVLNPGGQTTEIAPGMFPTGKSGAATATNAKGFPFVDYTVASMADSFKFGTLDFSEFKAVLELLKERTDTDTISNPRIATLNNNKAIINVGETISMPNFERNSTTGKMEITGYVDKEYGVILSVTPHINDNQEIALDVVPKIDNFLGFKPLVPGSDIYTPTSATRRAETQVIVKDGQTIFIGGLISEREIERNNKLPFLGDMLGDVPYLGLLFSKKDIVKQRVELIFFITVHIMSPDEVTPGSPLPDKAYVPMYSETQKEMNAPKKKRLKKKY